MQQGETTRVDHLSENEVNVILHKDADAFAG